MDEFSELQSVNHPVPALHEHVLDGVQQRVLRQEVPAGLAEAAEQNVRHFITETTFQMLLGSHSETSLSFVSVPLVLKEFP